jgi:hypothetical protein
MSHPRNWIVSSVSMMSNNDGQICRPRCDAKLRVSGGPDWFRIDADLTRKRRANGAADPRTYQRNYMRRRRAAAKAAKQGVANEA